MERLLERDLTATSFDPAARGGALPARARTVVVGAGIVGSSVAYHLARSARRCSCSSEPRSRPAPVWHAAGLVVRGRVDARAHRARLVRRRPVRARSPARPASTSTSNQCGSLTLARTPGRLDELRYLAGICRHTGIPNELIAPARRAGAVPARRRRRPGRRAPPTRGRPREPGPRRAGAGDRAHTRAARRSARACDVTGVRTQDGDRVTAVETDHGRRRVRARRAGRRPVDARPRRGVRRGGAAVAGGARARADRADRRRDGRPAGAPRPRRVLLRAARERAAAGRRVRAGRQAARSGDRCRRTSRSASSSPTGSTSRRCARWPRSACRRCAASSGRGS